ncbi:MAG: hypothetical protein QCH99_02285 [Candidatus Bathyarchaeota archaeon]|nr:hypothetical protein [Candidatus Bathyarchaeum tardum]
MKKCSNRANKGQFSIIAALLVSVILVSAVISTYTNVRHSEVPESSNVLSVIGQMNSDIKSILDFTVGYYGSILQVTGNSTYAKNQTTSYLSSGLVNIARSHPEWNPTFTLDLDGEYADVSTRWFMPDSYSRGSVNVTYSIGSLGIYDVSFHASSALHVTILEAPIGFANISITRDNSEPELGLSKENFWFFTYTEDSTWELINPPEVRISNGFYIITLPSGVDTASYSVQVEDNRGLLVSAFYSQKSVASESRIPHFTYYFDWASTGVWDIYNSLETDIFAIELLQNGTLKWLGQPLELPDAHPIPPVSIKAFRVNATIDDNSCEIPFQVEDWASDYTVPLGLAGNNSIFNNNNMLVFLVNHTIDEITLWWDGNDTAIQTSYAWENIYFDDDVDSNPGTLYNGFLDLTINNFWIESSVRSNPSVRSIANFAHFNLPDGSPQYGDQLSYVIYNGIVRDIVQQEPEYYDGVYECPNLYVQVFLTLPANAPYYTYSVRTVFLESINDPRTITDFSVIQLSDLSGTPLTEDGYDEDGYPETSDSSGEYFDGYPSDWAHHWSQFSSGDSGAGIMFTDSANEHLYLFDGITGTETGALVVDGAENSIAFNPVEAELNNVNGHTDFLDAVWYGAVVTFDGEPIYTSPANGHFGLWVMVENPPALSMEEPIPGIDFVDQLSNVDSSPDKGSHSKFANQRAGPDSIFDTLTEANTGTEAVIKVEHIQFDFGVGGSTTSVTDVGDLDNAFFRNNVARRTSAGPTASSSHTNWNVFSAGAQLTGTDELTGYRATGQTATIRIRGEVWRYTGTAGGANEFIVRWRGVVTIASGSKTSSQAVSGISNRDKCVPFVQGVIGDINSRDYGNRVISHAHIDSSDNLIVERGETGTEVKVYVVVVEFTGSNWDVGHALGSSFSTGDNNVALFDGSDGTGNSFDVGGWDTAFIEASMSGSTSDNDALEDTWFVIEPQSGSTTGVTISFDSTAGLTGTEVFVHIIQNDNINVNRYTDSQDIPTSDNHAVSGLTSLDESALEWYVFTDGTGTAYARGATGAYLTSTTNVAEWSHRTGNSGTYRFGVINMSGLVDTNYEIDLEVQWTNVDYDETNAELCIYVNTISGEDLRVDIWTGTTWETVIDALQAEWNNETISSYLTSSTFTIRFKGTQETGDTTQDSWAIDATLLRTWS